MGSWVDILYKLKDILSSIGTYGTLIVNSLSNVEAKQTSIDNKLNDVKILIDRGYVELQAQGVETQYDLPDPRIKTADMSKIRCIGDIIDDSDWKGINIPIVETFIDYTGRTPSQRMDINSQTPKKEMGVPIFWDDITYRIEYGRNRWMVELQDKRILDTIIIFPQSVDDTFRIAWRILPENATEQHYADGLYTTQTLSQQSLTFSSNRIAILDGETDIQLMKTVYSNGKLYIGMEWLEGATRYTGMYSIAFNPNQGFGIIGDVHSRAPTTRIKSIDIFKGKGGSVFFIRIGDTSLSIYKNENTSPLIYIFGNTYPTWNYLNGSGVMATAYLGDDTDDTVLVVFAKDTSSMYVYKIQFVTGSNTNPPTADLILTGKYMSTSSARVVQMYSLVNGEVQITYYDDDEGDYTELCNVMYGDTGSYSLYYDTHTSYVFVNTDKIYMVRFDGSQGDTVHYYLSPINLSVFAEAIIDYDDLTILFSTPLVSGSKFYITDYISVDRIVKNEVTYDEDGHAVRKPLLTQARILNVDDGQINPATEGKQDAIITALNTKDYFTEVARGNISGQSVVIKFGINDAVSTSSEVLWDNGGGYNWLASATLLNFTSDNINDTLAGSGASTLTIYGLDSNYNLQEEVISLTGQTIVQSVNTYRRLYMAIVSTEGATANANTGTLYCFTGTETNGVPDDSTKIYMAVRPTLGQTLMAVYTVPAGKTAYLKAAWITSGENKAVTGQLFTRPVGGAKNLKMDVNIQDYLFLRSFILSQSFAEKTDIWIEGKVDVGTIQLSGGFDLLLIDN